MASTEPRDPASDQDDWVYHPIPDFDQSLPARLKSFPRQPEMFVYALRLAGALALRGWLRLYHRLQVQGRENLPEQGSFVLVANHSSHLDALSLVSALPLAKLHRTFPAAAADYFFSSLPRTSFSAIFINALPFERKLKGAESLALCRAILENAGNVLVLFPEGTRSPSGRLGRFRSGIGRLVVGTTVPVVPCWIEGAARAWPKGSHLPRPRALRLIIGRPRSFETKPPTRASVREICEGLHAAVLELAGRRPPT